MENTKPNKKLYIVVEVILFAVYILIKCNHTGSAHSTWSDLTGDQKAGSCKGKIIYFNDKKTLEYSDQKYQNSRVFFSSFQFTLPRSDATPTLSHSPVPRRRRSMGRRDRQDRQSVRRSGDN